MMLRSCSGGTVVIMVVMGGGPHCLQSLILACGVEVCRMGFHIN